MRTDRLTNATEGEPPPTSPGPGRTSPPPEFFDPELFPTPRPVIDKMLKRLDDGAHYILEPSAGRGDIVEALQEKREYGFQRRHFEIDCIEASPDLCAILHDKGFTVVGSDWLSYDGVSYYDAIVMNPPFSKGARHLLQAWNFMHSGEIICLLNAETLANPCTAERERLAGIVEKHGETEDIGACFRNATRTTDVEVVLVHLRKTAVDDRIELWDTGTEERELGNLLEESNLPAVRDHLGNIQRFYDEGNRHMLLAFEHARKAVTYLEANHIDPGEAYQTILGHSVRSSLSHSRAEFLRLHRKDAWLAVFSLMDFHKWLDKKQTDELLSDVSRHGHFPFTAENIKNTLANVITQRRKLFEQSAWNVFEALTRYFHGNTNYDEGWKSNDAFRVNPKLVFPYGVEYDHQYGTGFSPAYGSSVIDIYCDLDRVLSVLDGERFDRIYTIGGAIELAIRRDPKTPQKTSSHYFDVRYFKKGTVHLKWKRPDLLEKFSLTAAQGRLWLGDSRGSENRKQAASRPML